jgi:hypothetical protein
MSTGDAPDSLLTFQFFEGELVWEKELPLGPAGTQYVAVAVGGGLEARIVAYTLP